MNWPIWCARSFVTSRRWCKYVFFSLQNPLISCFFQFCVSQRVNHRVFDYESESEEEESEEEGNTKSVSLYVFSQLRTNGHLFLGERQKTWWIDYLPHERVQQANLTGCNLTGCKFKHYSFPLHPRSRQEQRKGVLVLRSCADEGSSLPHWWTHVNNTCLGIFQYIFLFSCGLYMFWLFDVSAFLRLASAMRLAALAKHTGSFSIPM